MPEIIEVQDFSVSTTAYDWPVGTLLVRPNSIGGKYALRRTDRKYPWKSVEIETILSSHGHYADSVDSYNVTFTGGTPSSRGGWELPFATHPPRDTRLDENVVWSTSSPEEKTRRHDQRIRDLVRNMLGYEIDCVGGEQRGMGQIYLRSFELVERGYFHTTYRFTVVKPNIS